MYFVGDFRWPEESNQPPIGFIQPSKQNNRKMSWVFGNKKKERNVSHSFIRRREIPRPCVRSRWEASPQWRHVGFLYNSLSLSNNSAGKKERRGECVTARGTCVIHWPCPPPDQINPFFPPTWKKKRPRVRKKLSLVEKEKKWQRLLNKERRWTTPCSWLTVKGWCVVVRRRRRRFANPMASIDTLGAVR